MEGWYIQSILKILIGVTQLGHWIPAFAGMTSGSFRIRLP